MGKTKISDWIKTTVIVPRVSKLNRRMKRMVTIASLFGYIFNKKESNDAMVERLSKIMNLSNNCKAIVFPLIYHNLFWGSVERKHLQELTTIKINVTKKLHKETISNEDIDSCAKMLMSILPNYLLYDNFSVIRQDLAHLMESVPFILEPQTEYQ